MQSILAVLALAFAAATSASPISTAPLAASSVTLEVPSDWESARNMTLNRRDCVAIDWLAGCDGQTDAGNPCVDINDWNCPTTGYDCDCWKDCTEVCDPRKCASQCNNSCTACILSTSDGTGCSCSTCADTECIADNSAGDLTGEPDG